MVYFVDFNMRGSYHYPEVFNLLCVVNKGYVGGGMCDVLMFVYLYFLGTLSCASGIIALEHY